MNPGTEVIVRWANERNLPLRRKGSAKLGDSKASVSTYHELFPVNRYAHKSPEKAPAVPAMSWIHPGLSWYQFRLITLPRRKSSGIVTNTY